MLRHRRFRTAQQELTRVISAQLGDALTAGGINDVRQEFFLESADSRVDRLEVPTARVRHRCR
jgi:hypothetical protein